MKQRKKKTAMRTRLEQLLASDKTAELEGRSPRRYPKIKGQKYACSACGAIMFYSFLKCPHCEKGEGVVIQNDNANNPDTSA